MNYDYNLTPKEDTYLALQLQIASVVDETSRLFYWAARDDRSISDSFSEEKADTLYNIMRRGRDHTETMVRCYYKSNISMHRFELIKIQKWAENINKNIHLYEGYRMNTVKAEMEGIERCFELITSNGWVN